MSEPLPPHIIALADQELAATDTVLDYLIVHWQSLQPYFDREGFDRLKRITTFMGSELIPLHLLGWALLAVAIERLGKR